VDSKEDKAGHLIEPRPGRPDRLDFILCKNEKSRAVTPSNKKSRAVTLAIRSLEQVNLVSTVIPP
jgi:hypothetical protein